MAAVVTLATSYIVAALLFGVAEPSLMTWLIPFIPLAFSLIVVPPDFSVVCKHLYIVGLIMAVLVIAESVSGLSFNDLLRSNLSVQEYLRSGRALGSTGNPLFTSSVLLVSFFMPFRSNAASMAGRVVIVAAIVLTGSKSAVIGLALGLLLFALSKGFKRFAISLGIIAAMLTVFQFVLDTAFNGIFRRFAVFSDLRTSDPDRAFTTEFVLSWIRQHPAGGTPVGSALIDKRILSPVAGGSRFGIESTWLAMAADSGIFFVGIALLLFGLHCVKYRSLPTSQALFALTVSLFFWNGLYGSWVITPLLLVIALLPVDPPKVQPYRQGVTHEQPTSLEPNR
ncbi:O-antigen ligase family protein [Paenarthrobacter nicotinovorans]|uniref:O-antigen ligase family protein n=1 Tax=Paenarthrobacter nicotinovorans TaxID=29320 RepID=UPI003823D520